MVGVIVVQPKIDLLNQKLGYLGNIVAFVKIRLLYTYCFELKKRW